ncbi:MAG: cytochrome c oxidase subunit II [Pirellulales bacterium]
MGKFWSLLFLLVPILGVLCFAAAPLMGYWLPADISEHGYRIDHLFKFCLYLTGVVFIVTEVVLFWFMWRYDGRTNRDPVKFSHGSHNLEIVWTIVPAATLLFIAIYQMNAWADAKIRTPNIPATVEVTGRQFEWRIRYPGPDGELGTADDIHDVNDLHLPVNEQIVLNLKSMDVLHDFFVPQLRIKQDAVPGNKIPMWFTARETGTYEIVCAELCGWGHYKMKGRLTVETREAFDAWLKQRAAEQKATQ